jgi:hypothetical protein
MSLAHATGRRAGSPGATRLIAVFLTLHGLIHGLGFVSWWRLAALDGLPYTTVVANGAFDVGHVGIRLLALAWLVAGGALLIAAALVWRRSAMAVRAAWAAATCSLVICLLGLPASILGVAIDVAILTGVVVVAARSRRPAEPRPSTRPVT